MQRGPRSFAVVMIWKYAHCFCLFWFLLQLFLKAGDSHSVIYISQQYGNNTRNCLSHSYNATSPCQSLHYVFEHFMKNNDTSVDIVFVNDTVYLVKTPLVLHINPEKNLHLRMYSAVSGPSFFLRCSRDSSGLFRINGHNLTLHFNGIIFEQCGGNKTSLPAIIAKHTRKISFFSCVFQDNWSSGLFVINSDVHVHNCTFRNNSFDNVNKSCAGLCRHSNAMGGAVGILFRSERGNMSANISQSFFINNRVHANNERYYVADKDPKNVTIRGGALHITLDGRSSFLSTIDIRDCRFYENLATIGGALQIESYNTATNNNIKIARTSFSKNNGTQIGGAFMMSLWDFASQTSLTMTDIHVVDNWSRSGSGIYIYLKSEDTVSKFYDIQTFLFRRVHIQNNSGPTASGVKIVSPLFGRRSIKVVPVFENCTFINNINFPFNGYGYLPSFIVDRVDINFTGSNIFSGNKYFGAALFSNSLIHVHGSLKFIGNIGSKGGALSMINSQITLNPGSEVRFLYNHAKVYGGAMDVVTSPIYRVAVVKNPICFVTYSEGNVPENKWKANVYFINNTAALKGPAINIDSLILCGWNAESKKLDFDSSLKWNHTFHYEGNVICQSGNISQCQKAANHTPDASYGISTNVAKLVERSGVKTLQISPGESAVVDVSAYDELHKPVFTVIGGFVNNKDGSRAERFIFDRPFYLLPSQKENKVYIKYTLNTMVRSPPNSSAQLYFLDLFSDGEIPFLDFTIIQKGCLPGFLHHENTCVCNKNFPGVIGCTTDGHYVQFKEGYWVGLIDNKFTAIPCPFGFCTCPSKNQLNNTEVNAGCFYNAVNYNNDSLVCANNRRGYLCGECQKNYTVGIQSFKCVLQGSGVVCTSTTVASVLLTILLCILVLYFNPGLDNELRGPLFFFQVLPLYFPPLTYNLKKPDIVYNLVVFLSSIFDFTLPFFGYFISKCYLFEGIDNLTMLAFGYSSSILAFLVFSTAFLLSYKRGIFIRRKNAVQCFWLLLIFMYTSLVKTSLRILNCPFIHGKLRLYEQASVVCYDDNRHVAIAVFAIIIMLFCGLVIPLLIIVMTATSFLKLDPHYVDTLINNLKPGCLWWWVVDLLRRLLVVILGVLIPIWNQKQVSLILASTLILGIHCFFHPYKQLRSNVTEAVFLFVLCGVGVIQMLQISDEDQAKMNMGVISTMLAYTGLLILYKLVVVVQRKARGVPDLTEYENLDNSTTTANVSDQSLEERREKLDALVSRSRLLPPSRSEQVQS